MGSQPTQISCTTPKEKPKLRDCGLLPSLEPFLRGVRAPQRIHPLAQHPKRSFGEGRWSLTRTQENSGPPETHPQVTLRRASLCKCILSSLHPKRTSFLKRRDTSGEPNRWALLTPKRIIKRSLGASRACRIASGTRSTRRLRSAVGGGRPQVASCPQFSEPPG